MYFRTEPATSFEICFCSRNSRSSPSCAATCYQVRTPTLLKNMWEKHCDKMPRQQQGALLGTQAVLRWLRATCGAHLLLDLGLEQFLPHEQRAEEADDDLGGR
jgi:hypothetical protein